MERKAPPVINVPQVDRGRPDVVYIPEPERTRSIGPHAVDVLRECGVAYLPWHELVLRHAMAKHDDDRWVSRDVALVLPWRDDRQTDQSIAFQRAIIGTVLLGECVLYVSENVSTALIMFNAFTAVVESMPVLRNLVSKICRANGEQGVTFQGGGSVKFRTAGRARGISADLVIADNVHQLHDSFEDNVGPTLATSPNAQTWWIDTTRDSWRYTLLKQRALVAVEQPVLYLEWSARA
jgi:hypothetical protein